MQLSHEEDSEHAVVDSWVHSLGNSGDIDLNRNKRW